MGRLRGFLRLRLGDQLRLLTAAGLLLVTWATLEVSFDRYRSALLGGAGLGRRVVPGNPAAARVAWAVDAADRHVPGDRTCLVRSLTTEALLVLYGYDPDHRIGVDRTEEGAVEAHSWIEHEGEILIGKLDDHDRYEPLPSLEGPEGR